jgi:excinuclease UvrABC ATPase subunit
VEVVVMRWNGFNFSDENQCNCPECRGVTDINHMEIDVYIDDPNDIIDEYFEIVKDAQSEEELYDILVEFYNAAVDNTYKQVLLNEINEKVAMLNDVQYGDDEE